MKLTKIKDKFMELEERIKSLERINDKRKEKLMERIKRESPKIKESPKEEYIDMSEPEKQISSMKILEPSRKTERTQKQEKRVNLMAQVKKEKIASPEQGIAQQEQSKKDTKGEPYG